MYACEPKSVSLTLYAIRILVLFNLCNTPSGPTGWHHIRYAIEEVSEEIEDPFGDDLNDLPTEVQHYRQARNE